MICKLIIVLSELGCWHVTQIAIPLLGLNSLLLVVRIFGCGIVFRNGERMGVCCAMPEGGACLQVSGSGRAGKIVS